VIRQSLNGTWNLCSAANPADSLTAPVPGCIHDALLEHGRIPDIFFRKNELEALWVADETWIYERSFELSDELLAEQTVELVCEGLDTFAAISINDKAVAETDNMFRTYRWNVKNFLNPGENTIHVAFSPVVPYMTEKFTERQLPAWSEPQSGIDWGYNGRGYVRKQACQFGWDWGPMTPSAGIWKSIRIEAWTQARIADWQIKQTHADSGEVTLEVSTSLLGEPRADCQITVSLSIDGNTAVCASNSAQQSSLTTLAIRNPRLWWPNGLGEQPLYKLKIELTDAAGNLLDLVEKRIGLRTLKLIREPDEYGTSFVFAANGVRFFAKGANWIPLDEYPGVRDAKRYETLLADAAEAHMNMIRIWGGGYYGDDDLYDLCDEMGICIWQDMMFACGSYPTWDDAFMSNVAEELKDNVKRLRHHVSLACWCGNNELEQGLCGEEWTAETMAWKDYLWMFDEWIPSVLAKVDRDTPYIPGSPHAAPSERKESSTAKSGDLHCWEIWFENVNFENYRNYPHRFISEFGFQSFPEPRTIASFTRPEDRSHDSEIMLHRERSEPGTQRVADAVGDWFEFPDNFDDLCRLSQIVHGVGLKIGIENWRRNWPRTTGTTYWQINDVWPTVSWSSIDVFGRWKALHYMARRFFEPVMISGVENPKEGSVEVAVCNDRRREVSGTATVTITDTDGTILEKHAKAVSAAPMSVSRREIVNVQTHLAKHGAEDILVWLDFEGPNVTRTGNFVHFARPRKMALPDPRIQVDVTEEDGVFCLTVASEKPALWVWLWLDNGDCRFSDSFRCIRSGQAWGIRAEPAEELPLDEFRRRLRVRSVFDTVPDDDS